jgi:hypothetical protein
MGLALFASLICIRFKLSVALVEVLAGMAPATWPCCGMPRVSLVCTAIVRYAEGEGINLGVLGRYGHSRIVRFSLGATTARVSERSPCSVMIVK